MDVGANIGYFTLLMARQVGPGGRVIAFEPLPTVYSVLCENLRLNELHWAKAECKARRVRRTPESTGSGSTCGGCSVLTLS